MNITRQTVLDMLYKKYILPTKDKRDLYIGVEIELPIVNLLRKPVDFDIVHDLTRRFKSAFGFYVSVIDEEKNPCSLLHFGNDDILSYDCSYNNLELSFGKEKNLFAIQERFLKYYDFIQNFLAQHNYTLTGMGVNPFRGYNTLLPIPNGRYRMLYHHLSSAAQYRDRIPMFFHPWPAYGMFSSASRVQLDVFYDDLIPAIRAFSQLEPLKSVLFSNSVMTGEREDLLCCRDMLWENSTQGINPHNIGMFDKIPENIDELLEYIASTSIYCAQQGDKYFNFEPVNVVEYFTRRQIWGEYYDIASGLYKQTVFSPKPDDLKYLRSFKFEDLTFRGTIDFRSVCCQPIYDAFCVSAFHLGLMGRSQIEKINELLNGDRVIYGHGYNASELRRLMNMRKIAEFVDTAKLSKLLMQILSIAQDGLKARGLGEEIFLEPLFKRAQTLENPARAMLSRIESGEAIENIIKDYACAVCPK
jgi:gamma-glutamylcysteine synthetase